MEDIIYIKDLRIKTIIGIFDWERKVKQEVSIDMEFPFDCKKRLKLTPLKIQQTTKQLQRLLLNLSKSHHSSFKKRSLKILQNWSKGTSVLSLLN